jgi:hypothetical protein
MKKKTRYSINQKFKPSNNPVIIQLETKSKIEPSIETLNLLQSINKIKQMLSSNSTEIKIEGDKTNTLFSYKNNDSLLNEDQSPKTKAQLHSEEKLYTYTKYIHTISKIINDLNELYISEKEDIFEETPKNVNVYSNYVISKARKDVRFSASSSLNILDESIHARLPKKSNYEVKIPRGKYIINRTYYNTDSI